MQHKLFVLFYVLSFKIINCFVHYPEKKRNRDVQHCRTPSCVRLYCYCFSFFSSLILYFCPGFYTNSILSNSQIVQFRDFFLRANKYNCLKMAGDGASDQKLILVKVCISAFSLKHCLSKYHSVKFDVNFSKTLSQCKLHNPVLYYP